MTNSIFYNKENDDVCQTKVCLFDNSYYRYRVNYDPEIYPFLEGIFYRLLPNFETIGQGLRPYRLPCLQGFFSQFKEAFRRRLRYQEFSGIKAFADCQRGVGNPTEAIGFYTCVRNRNLFLFLMPILSLLGDSL